LKLFEAPLTLAPAFSILNTMDTSVAASVALLMARVETRGDESMSAEFREAFMVEVLPATSAIVPVT